MLLLLLLLLMLFVLKVARSTQKLLIGTVFHITSFSANLPLFHIYKKSTQVLIMFSITLSYLMYEILFFVCLFAGMLAAFDHRTYFNLFKVKKVMGAKIMTSIKYTETIYKISQEKNLGPLGSESSALTIRPKRHLLLRIFRSKYGGEKLTLIVCFTKDNSPGLVVMADDA